MEEVGSRGLPRIERVTTGVDQLTGPPAEKPTRMAGCCDLRRPTLLE